MYTISALWTHAREGSTSRPSSTTTAPTPSCAPSCSRSARRVLVGDGARARSLLDLSRPRLDFVALAAGMGVPATSVDTAEGLADALRRAAAEAGPHLIEAVVPPAVA